MQIFHRRFVLCSASQIYPGVFAKFVFFSEYMNFKGCLKCSFFLRLTHGWNCVKQTEKFCIILIKFILCSEKATKFCEISTVDLFYVVPVKSTLEILQKILPFSEYMNFTTYCKLNVFTQCVTR